MPQVAKSVNSDLSKGFSVPQVAQKHGWPEPMVWSQALVSWEDLPILNSKDKPDLIIFDPPYFDKKAKEYAKVFRLNLMPE